MTAIVRPREWLSLDVDSRVMKLFPSDCLAIPFPIVARGPGVTEQFLGSRGSPAGPLLLRRSTMHVGLETPRNLPLARVTLGAGALWSRNPLPLGTMAVGLGGRGDGVRFYMEYEYNVSRIRLSDIYERRTEVAGGVRIETISRSTVHHPTWRTVRAGLELPMMWLGMHSPTRPESSRSRQAQAVRPA